MMRVLCMILFSAIAVLAASAAEDAELRAKTEALVKQLGSDEFERREAASAALKKIVPQVYEQLESARDAATDAEVKQRLNAIIASCPKIPFNRRGTAAIRGKVLFKGEVPKRKPIDLSGVPAAVEFYKDKPKPLKRDLIVGEKGEVADVLLYISCGLERYTFGAPAEPVVLNLVGFQFEPHVFGIMAGQQMLIKNGDSAAHNIHGISTTRLNKEFNLSQPKQGIENRIKFDAPEVGYRLKSDIHPFMQAWCSVFDHPFFTVTKPDGTFEIRGLPAGSYKLTARHFGGLKEQSIEIQVKQGEAKDVEMTLEK